MTEDMEQCFCENCSEKFFEGFKHSNGAYVVVCISCGETVMCYYDIGGANDS